MATNIVHEEGNQLSVPVPVGTVSGDPVAVGGLPGVALIDRGADTAGEATVKFNGTATLDVTGEDDAGNTAIAVGDILYLQSDGTINADATTGIRFGYALGTVSSGATTGTLVKIGY